MPTKETDLSGSRGTTRDQPQRRRDRRAAHRHERRRDPSPPAAGAWWRSPVAIVTFGAVAIGAVLVAAIALRGGGPTYPPGATNAAGLVVPSVLSPTNLASGRSIGRPEAPATLTVWEDFQCPLCGEFTRQVEPKLYADFVVPGSLRIVYRDYAFIGPESFDAATAARCAGDQGRFWPYHDYLFWNQGTENGGAFRPDRLDAIADAVGLDRASFDACLAAGLDLAQVKAETAAAEQAGIAETPTLVVDKDVMPGVPLSDEQYAALKNVIVASIAAHASSTP